MNQSPKVIISLIAAMLLFHGIGGNARSAGVALIFGCKRPRWIAESDPGFV
jgi:hypothetical protein